MNRKKLICSVAVLNTLGLFAESAVFVRAGKESAVYKVNEPIVFKIDRREITEPLCCEVYLGSKVLTRRISGNQVKVTMDRPGFVLIKLFTSQQKNICIGIAGAAVEPEKLAPSGPRPADFDKFWDNELKKLNESRMTVSRLPVESKFVPEGMQAYDVTLTQGDVTATGFLVMPKDASPKSLPAVASFLGASKINAELNNAATIAGYPAISFNLNFHGLKNYPVLSAEEYGQIRSRVDGYMYRNADSAQSYPMRKIFLRTVMVMNYLKSLPEFDGVHLASYGGSLGGCQAVVAAALVPEVSFCIATAPAMCDHHGMNAGRIPGWPGLLQKNGQAEDTAAYFDVVNFVPRIKCPLRMAVGFIDDITPPSSSYTAYNAAVTADRKMKHVITGGHGGNLFEKQDDVFSCWNKELKKYCNEPISITSEN